MKTEYLLIFKMVCRNDYDGINSSRRLISGISLREFDKDTLFVAFCNDIWPQLDILFLATMEFGKWSQKRELLHAKFT
jgi:hypothetical protein